MLRALALSFIATATACAAVIREPSVALDEPEESPARGVIVVPDATPPVAEAEPPAVEPSVEVRACIDDAIADALHRGPTSDVFSSPPDNRDALAIESLVDLDGDGTPEQLVTHSIDCGATGNCPWLIYLSSDGCPQFAGSFWSAYHDRMARTRKGVHDLQTWTKGGCAGLEGTFTQLAWSGATFEPVASINCDCNVDDPQRDPECPSVD